jgi:transcription elongation factor GreB
VVEAAWSYRHGPASEPALRKRQEGVPEEIKEIAWKAQNRLHKRYMKLTGGGGKDQRKIMTAVGRELLGFIWAIGIKAEAQQATNGGLTKNRKTKAKTFQIMEKAKTNQPMNSIAQFEDRASRSRSKHEGESSAEVCDRLSRTRDLVRGSSRRIMIMRFRPANIRLINRRHYLPRLLLTLSERPAVVEVVAWAASNGDRSENADYQYGKRRLRQIDGRIRFLTKRIEAAEVVDPEAPRAGQAATRAFFGATVRYANAAGAERVVSIVGTDEVDLNRNHISWVSPLGRALMKSAAGDSVVLQAPGGTEYLTVLEVCYERISVEPFREPPGSEASAKGLPRRRWANNELSLF